jgi:HSP20 family protein
MTEKKTRKSLPTDSRDPDGNTLPTLPSIGLERIFEQFMRPFDDFFQPFFPRTTQTPFGALESMRQPTLDIQDRGDHFTLTAQLPGFAKDEVEVKVSSNSIEVKAEKSETNSKEKGAQIQSHSVFHQYLTLPEGVITEKIGGTMKNGILELRLPKQAPKLQDKTRRVDLN